MKFVSMICGFVASIKVTTLDNPANPTDAGVNYSPPINRASEVLYNSTVILPFHKLTIPPSHSEECNMHYSPFCSDLKNNWHHIGDQWEGPAPTPGYAQ